MEPPLLHIGGLWKEQVNVMSMAILLIVSGMFTGATGDETAIEQAQRNGLQAQEALVRSQRVTNAYLKLRDPVTGLLPRKEGTDTWYVRDSAADLYPFLVMCAFYTDRPVYDNEMHELLRNEIKWSTRVGHLSDNVLAGGGFGASIICQIYDPVIVDIALVGSVFKCDSHA